MIRPRGLWPVTILLSAAGIGVLAFAGLESPIRAVIALWFLFVCPGMAFVRLLRIEDALTELTLAVALSLALDGLVAGTMLYAGMWSPQWGLALLICMSAAGAALQVFSGRSRCVSGVPRDRSGRECHDDRYRTVVGHPALVPHNGAAPPLAPVAVPPHPVVPQVGQPTVALALPTTSAEPANHQQPGPASEHALEQRASVTIGTEASTAAPISSPIHRRWMCRGGSRTLLTGGILLAIAVLGAWAMREWARPCRSLSPQGPTRARPRAGVIRFPPSWR